MPTENDDVDGLTLGFANEMIRERIRQDKQWGKGRMDPMPSWIVRLGEEFGEVCKAFMEGGDVLEELTHCAAVCCAAWESEQMGRTLGMNKSEG
jgi:hypothetical protein